MSFPVFFDTCALYGEIVNDLVLRLAEERMFVPYWSNTVLDELQRVLTQRVGEQRARRRVTLMREAFPDAEISGFDQLIDTMTCEAGDRHVLAAADFSPASTLVTFNIKHFPANSVEPLDIEVKHPDDFLLDVFNLDPDRIEMTAYQALCSYRRYPQTPEDYVAFLAKSGLDQFSARLYPGIDALFKQRNV